MNTDYFYKFIGEKITTLRKKKGKSQEEIAKSLGVTRVTWNHMEKGAQKITVDRLWEIARLLEVKIFELLPQGDQDFDPATEEKFGDLEKHQVLSELNKLRTKK